MLNGTTQVQNFGLSTLIVSVLSFFLAVLGLSVCQYGNSLGSFSHLGYVIATVALILSIIAFVVCSQRMKEFIPIIAMVWLSGCSTLQPPTPSISEIPAHSMLSTHALYISSIELSVQEPHNSEYKITLREINEDGTIKIYSHSSQETLIATLGQAFANEDGSPSQAFGRSGLGLKEINEEGGSILLERWFCTLE